MNLKIWFKMKFEFEKEFVKDFRKLKSRELASLISEVITQVSNASSSHEITTVSLKETE